MDEARSVLSAEKKREPKRPAQPVRSPQISTMGKTMKSFSRMVLLAVVVVAMLGCRSGSNATTDNTTTQDRTEVSATRGSSAMLAYETEFEKIRPFIDRDNTSSLERYEEVVRNFASHQFLLLADEETIKKVYLEYPPLIRRVPTSIAKSAILSDVVVLFHGRFLRGDLTVIFDDVSEDIFIDKYPIIENDNSSYKHYDQTVTIAKDFYDSIERRLHGPRPSEERERRCAERERAILKMLDELSPYSRERWIQTARRLIADSFPGYQISVDDCHSFATAEVDPDCVMIEARDNDDRDPDGCYYLWHSSETNRDRLPIVEARRAAYQKRLRTRTYNNMKLFWEAFLQRQENNSHEFKILNESIVAIPGLNALEQLISNISRHDAYSFRERALRIQMAFMAFHADVSSQLGEMTCYWLKMGM